MRAAEALGQMQSCVPAAPRVDLAFDRGCRGREHDRNFRLAATYHRHVAGVVANAVLLLVGGIVLLIDHDQPEIGVGQEQRRARPDHHRNFAFRHRAPGAGAQTRRKLGMPFRRPHAEALGKAIKKLRRQRDLRHQDQHLAAAPHRLGHRLEIDLGLARTGDAIDQRHREAALLDRGTERVGGGALRRGKIRLAMVGIGRSRHRHRRQRQRFDRALIDQPVDHAGRYAGFAGSFSFAAERAVAEQFQHPAARRRHPPRRRARKPHADLLAFGAKLRPHAQRHAQHHAARRKRVARHPVDETPQLRAQRRNVELVLDLLHPVVQARLDRNVVRPDHAHGGACAERHVDDVAGRQRHAVGHPIGVGLIERDRHQDIDKARGHGGDVADSGRLRKGEGRPPTLSSRPGVAKRRAYQG